MVSHIVFGAHKLWAHAGQYSPFAAPLFFFICILYKSYVRRCVEVKCILTLSTYPGFSKSIDSKDDNYCTVLISKWFEHTMRCMVHIYSVSNVSDENGYSTKTTSLSTIHTHECITRMVTLVT